MRVFNQVVAPEAIDKTRNHLLAQVTFNKATVVKMLRNTLGTQADDYVLNVVAKRIIADLRHRGLIVCEGHTRGAMWTWRNAGATP